MGSIDVVRPGGYPQEARGSAVMIPETGDFTRILREKMESRQLMFSQHALSRLQGREINLTPATLDKLDNAVSQAAAKGARESLVLVEDLALVVSVTNRTVITALEGAERRGRVFTNIDSAVIV